MESYENNNEEKSIEKTVKEGLENPNFDLALDYAELALDSFMDNDAVKEIPVVKSIVGLFKGGLKIREIYFAKKLVTFLKEFHSGTLPDEKKAQFKEKFNADEKYRDSVVEQIMVLNDRFLEISKSKILANLFLAHLNDKYDWEGFLSLSYCVERLNLSATDYFHELAALESPFYKGYSQFDDNAAFLISAGIGQEWGTHFQVTNHGVYLYFYGIKGDIHHVFKQPDQTEGSAENA
ncbi:hypothetical protein ACS5PU_02105 [Pedobacter sp. GSP4]|uniref:hypothetical protein n=1 Tax=Pedobacter sp. GSP4 TaxID=3453716 RepID=UPI003EEC5DA5